MSSSPCISISKTSVFGYRFRHEIEACGHDGYEQLKVAHEVDGNLTATWTRGNRNKYEPAPLPCIGVVLWVFSQKLQRPMETMPDNRQALKVCHGTSSWPHLRDDHEAQIHLGGVAIYKSLVLLICSCNQDCYLSRVYICIRLRGYLLLTELASPPFLIHSSLLLIWLLHRHVISGWASATPSGSRSVSSHSCCAYRCLTLIIRASTVVFYITLVAFG